MQSLDLLSLLAVWLVTPTTRKRYVTNSVTAFSKGIISRIKSKIEKCEKKNEELRVEISHTASERDFYLEKTTKIEIMIKQVASNAQTSIPILQDILDVLYEQEPINAVDETIEEIENERVYYAAKIARVAAILKHAHTSSHTSDALLNAIIDVVYEQEIIEIRF